MTSASRIPDEDLDSFRTAQAGTRTLRLALNVILNLLVPLDNCDDACRAVADLYRELEQAEEEGPRELGRTWNYLIVRPLSPARLPPPGDLEKITGAVRTLHDFGLVINDTA